MFLLDTNVVSELRRNRPHGGVIAWVSARAENEMFIPAVSLGEIQRGIELTRLSDDVKAAEIERWLSQLVATSTILPMDGDDFRLWARLMVGKSVAVTMDAMIAATALNRGLTVATRNVGDFAVFNVPLVNPFA